MPELNRDKESLYRPGRLSLVFLVTSVLLLGVLAWMVFDDYSRPWKGIQKGYYAKRAEVLEAKRQEARAALGTEDKRRRLDELGGRLRAARAAVDRHPEVPELRRRLEDAQHRFEAIEAEFKAISGAWSEKKYEVEKARVDAEHGHGSAEDVRRRLDEYNALGTRRADLEAKLAVPAREARETEARLAEIEKTKKDLEKEWARETQELAGHEAALADAKQRGGSLWRNALGIDFLVPTIVPRKVVNQDVHDQFNFATSAKVDMCMSCHMGANDPLMVDPPERFHVDPVHRAHPHLDLILGPNSKHPMDSIGCTVCHAGRGWSLDFLNAAHTPRSAEQREDWERRFDWKPPRWVDFPMLPLPYTEGQCFKCHVEGLYYPPEQFHDEEVRVAGDLSPNPKTEVLGALVEPERLVRHELERAPKDTEAKDVPPGAYLVKTAGGEAFWSKPLRMTTGEKLATGERLPIPGAYVLAPAPAPRDAPTDPGKTPGAAWHPTRLEQGMEVATEYGCFGCHIVRDFPRVVGYPRAAGGRDPGPDFSVPTGGTLITGLPKVGWDLTLVGHKVTVDFLRRWIRNPNSYRIDTRMPSFFYFREHDDQWNPKMEIGSDGLPRPADRHVEVSAGPRDLVQTDVEVEALTSFFMWLAKQATPPDWPDPPAGDPKKGSDVFYSAGCYGCHLGPDRWDASSGDWTKDDGKRFEIKSDLPQGPRLTALGSKLKNPGWLYGWLAEPRHYWSTTRMPNMRWRDELAADGKTVVRSADQLRADVVAFLMRATDPAFLAQPVNTPQQGWTREHNKMLDEMWEEYYGKGLEPVVAQQRAQALPLYPPEEGARIDLRSKEGKETTSQARQESQGKLAAVGLKLVESRGCFGCHSIPGSDDAQPIGKELTGPQAEGTQDIHKFDFGLLHDEVPHTRWDWIETKVREPRIYDRGRVKRWTEKLKMPKFNVRKDDRTAITAFVLGLVREPILPGAMFRPDATERAIVAGRAVIARYGCNQCHNVEGEKGVLWEEQAKAGQEKWMLPPNLYGEGNRRRAEWLFRFLKAPHDLRPGVIQRMPMFRLSDAEASALVDYFVALAGRTDRVDYDPLDQPLDETPFPEPRTIEFTKGTAKQTVTARNAREEAKALFDALNCASCHLPRGTPGADPNDGGSAPPFTVVGPSLRREWITELLRDPQTQIRDTKMTAFWPLKRNRKAGDTVTIPQPRFRMGCPEGCTNDEIAEAQMIALSRYVIYHYDPTITAPAPPAPPESGTGDR